MNTAIPWQNINVTFILTGYGNVSESQYLLVMSEYSISVFNHEVNKT